ncbi:hypothetical protein L1049_023625 [Liquidambar formosana]|uniref:Uncharacterized protein n=1 Tax=Liquidambar formosana TaxID=63359 RepID=A0AAP0WYX7_LIQFO
MDTSSISTRGNNRRNGEEISIKPRVQTPSTNNCVFVCRKLDGMAMWLINGVAAAFFTSLKQMHCIRIDTKDDVADDTDSVPLICNDGNLKRWQMGRRSESNRNEGKKKGGSIEGEIPVN